MALEIPIDSLSIFFFGKGKALKEMGHSNNHIMICKEWPTLRDSAFIMEV